MAASNAKHRVWEFGLFHLDEFERLLLHDGQPIGLTPKVFDTLIALIEHSGHLVAKEELMGKLWPDTFVEEGALTRNISDLRKALGEEQYVETVPKRGYRFVAPVREVDDRTTLIVEKTTEAHLVIEQEEESTPGDTETVPLASYLRSGNRTQRILTSPAAIVVAGVFIIGGALGLRELLSSKASPDGSHRAFQTTQLSRFTTSGNILAAAISPDGKYVATAQDEGGSQSLWICQVAANTSSVRLVAPAQVDYWGLTFSNDSNFIYYVSWVRNESDAVLYQLPVLGGTPRRLPTTIDTPISFSPAGDRFAYVTSSSSKGESYVKLADADGGGVQTLARRLKPGFFTAYPGGPAWSPDGRFIAYAASGSVENDIGRARVFVANVEDKQERQLTPQSWMDVGRVAWMGDRSGLVISAQEQMDAPRQLWFVSYPEGKARRITNDLHEYDSLSLTADARTLAAVQAEKTFSISVTPSGDLGRVSPDLSSVREIFSEVGIGRERAMWTPDNRMVYCSRAGGNWDIWSMNKDGSDQKQLTVDSHNDLFPTVSSDGRYIYFASDRAGALNIWRMENDGSNPLQLTRGINQTLPAVTPDGQWVIYQQGLGLDEPSIWRVPAVGGEPEQLTNSLTLRPAVSPDGRLLAYVYLDEKEWGVAVVAFEGGEATKKFPFPPTVSSRFFRWTPDGQALAHIANERGASNIWLQPLNGDPPKQLTNFQAGQLFSFTWSPDGQWLAYMRHTATSDVVLLKDFK